MAAVDNEQCRDEAHRNGIHVEPQKIGELVNVLHHRQNIISLFEQFFGDAFGHGLVGLCAWVQVIARIKTAREPFGVIVPAYGHVEIYTAVEFRRSP